MDTAPRLPRGRLCFGIAAFSFHSLPHWGRGTASAVDRVLSYIVDLRRISPLIFHPARTLSGSLRAPPSPRGEGFVLRIPLSPSNLRPFGAPPSVGRRVCPHEPLPLEGAAERSEAGLASFFAAKPPPLYLPHRGKGTAQRRSGAFVNCLLETISLALFHTSRTISGSLRSPPFPRGEGFVSEIALSPSNLRPFGAPPSIGRREYPREPLPLEGAAERSEAGLASFLGRRSRLLFAFPIGEGGPRQRWIGCSRKRRT